MKGKLLKKKLKKKTINKESLCNKEKAFLLANHKQQF